MKRKNKLRKNKLQTIIARLLEMRFKIEDYIYSNKPIYKTEAMKYLEEVTAYKLKCKNMTEKDRVRIFQVSNTLISQLKVIIEEEDTIIDRNIESETTNYEERDKLNDEPDKSTDGKWSNNVVNTTESNYNELKHDKEMNKFDERDSNFKNIAFSNVLTQSQDINKELATLMQNIPINKENSEVIEISSDDTSNCGSQSILLNYDPNDTCYNSIHQYANTCAQNPNDTATNVFCNDADNITDIGNTEKYYMDKNVSERDLITKINKNTATEKEKEVANENKVLQLQAAENVEGEYSQGLVTNNKSNNMCSNIYKIKCDSNIASSCCDLENKSFNGTKLRVNNLERATISKKKTNTKLPIINKKHIYTIKSTPKIQNFKVMQYHNNNTTLYNTNKVNKVDINNISTGQINNIYKYNKDSKVHAQITANKEAFARNNFKVIKITNNDTGNINDYKNQCHQIDTNTAKTDVESQICNISKDSIAFQDTETVIHDKIKDIQISNRRQKQTSKRNNKETKSRKLDIGKDNSNNKRRKTKKDSSKGEDNVLKETNDLGWLSEIKYVRVVGADEFCQVDNLSEVFWTDFSLLPDLSENDFVIS